MIYSGPAHVFVFWMTTQLIVRHILGNQMIIPYISEFSYRPEHHPAENPSCPTRKSHKIRESRDDKYFITDSHRIGADDFQRDGKSSVEIIAMLVPCARTPNGPINNGNDSLWDSHLLQFPRITECRRKLVISVKLTTVGKTDTRDRFIVIDHVTDPVTMRRSRLMEPYVIKIRQEQVLQLYGLNFQSVVNAEATEEVINNKKENFMGCDDYSDHPTCGEMYYKGVKIPHSQGFCCPCDTDFPFQLSPNSTVSADGPQFPHKRFRDDTKSMESLPEDLQLPRLPPTRPSHLRAKKSSKPTGARGLHIPPPNVILKEYPQLSIETPLPKYPTNPSVNVATETSPEIPKQVEQPLIPKEVRQISRRAWRRNRLNRLRSILMKNHVRNNEKRHSDIPHMLSGPRNSSPDISKQIKVREIEKAHPSNTDESTSPEDHRPLPPSKTIDTTSLRTLSPQIIIDRFKIPPDIARKFVNRRLLHYPFRKSPQKTKKSAPQDFAISLTGKIHIDGGVNGGPMSITFDSPGVRSPNNPLKINRRSAESETPHEIIPRPLSKIARSLPAENLLSNELPENDSNELGTVTSLDRIRPYALPDEPTPPALPPNSAQNPVNLKIIGLISMSNPPSPKAEPKPNNDWLGNVEIVPLIAVKPEKQSSLEPPEETSSARPHFETTEKTVLPLRMTTKSGDVLPETVTFYIDSDEDEDAVTGSDGWVQTCPLAGNSSENQNKSSPPRDFSQTKTYSSSTQAVTERDDRPGEDSRLTNMLAVMDFINKLKRLITGDDCHEEPGTVIRLQKFVITPENNSDIEARILDDSGISNTSGASPPGIPANPPKLGSAGTPKQTYITRIINKTKNSQVEALETLRGKLIDEYVERPDDSNELRAIEIRDQSSLNSKGASGNNWEVGKGEIVRSGSRLLEEGRRRKRGWRKKKKRKKKKKKKKKWWRRFGRQLMSLDVQDVLDEIYDDESNGGAWLVGNGRYRGRNKREMSASGFQIRGGQNCMDRRHPPNVNPAKYLESAHCLRFSDLWYSVYKLEEPVVEHGVYIQIFKRERENTGWRDLTRGEMIRLGTFTRHQRDKIPTIVFTYTQQKSETPESSLNPNTQRLLIPLVENIEKKSETSEAMSEYLIIPSNQITSEGRECDKAGVGFSAFVMQKDRCTRKRGSCLRNQPLQYWRHDVNARQSGKPGCYFLSNFAEVPVNPIKYNVTDADEGREYLGLVQNNHHVSTLEIEVTADDNNVITTGSSARITEAYAVAEAERVEVSIRLTNTGLVSSDYQAHIVGCPSGLPNSWAHAITRKYRISPQHDSVATLDIPGRVIIDRFECNGIAFMNDKHQRVMEYWILKLLASGAQLFIEESVEVINYRGELVAARRIIVHKMNRCFCLWHCICTCYESPRGFSCLPMTPEHYHQAGFRGPVPTINPRTSGSFKTAIDILIIIIIIFTIFLAIGIVKWIIGVLSPPVGRWGLDNLVAGLRIEEYFEPELKCRCVITDDEGIPIHPDTGRRTVRLCSRIEEFIINSLFLFIYPSHAICHCVGKIAKCKRPRRSDDSKERLIDKERPRTISVRSYGDTRNSKLEQEDTEYVITELKKSQVSLQDFSNKSKNKF